MPGAEDLRGCWSFVTRVHSFVSVPSAFTSTSCLLPALVVYAASYIIGCPGLLNVSTVLSLPSLFWLTQQKHCLRKTGNAAAVPPFSCAGNGTALADQRGLQGEILRLSKSHEPLVNSHDHLA
jgi:hypothetical protein